MARSYEDFGTICCPEGAIGLSPGFQPWEALSKRICPEGARDHGATDGWHYACDLGSGAPSGLFAGEIRFPGLKPWAESYNPFGARVAGTTLNTSQTERCWSGRRSLAL